MSRPLFVVLFLTILGCSRTESPKDAAIQSEDKIDDFNEEFFSDVHRAAVSFDGTAEPKQLKSELQLIEAGIKTPKEKEVLKTFQLILDYQETIFLFKDVHSTITKIAADWATLKPQELAALKSVDQRKYDTLVEILQAVHAGYIPVRTEEGGVGNRIMAEKIRLHNIPVKKGRYTDWVEYAPAMNRLTTEHNVLLKVAGEMIYNNGTLPKH